MEFRHLRNYISLIVENLHSQFRKKLRVFDFDDTLVKTSSKIKVRSINGKIFELTPGEYAVYESNPGDQFDFSDFEDLIDPKEIGWTVKILRSVLLKGGKVIILTARSNPIPVQKFIKDSGLPSIEVVALGSSDPSKKAEHISNLITSKGFDFVEFFDDSYKNVNAVKMLSNIHPDVKIISRLVAHKFEIN